MKTDEIRQAVNHQTKLFWEHAVLGFARIVVDDHEEGGLAAAFF